MATQPSNESLPRKTASVFKEGIGQESSGAANQEKQIYDLIPYAQTSVNYFRNRYSFIQIHAEATLSKKNRFKKFTL